MNYTSDEDKGFSTSIKPGKRCYRCNVPIYFTSKEAETPSGKPTKDPSTRKVIPLDPSTHEYHVCKPQDIEAYSQTDECKNRVVEWRSKKQNSQEVVGGNTSGTYTISNASSNHSTNNSNVHLTLEKLVADIDQIKMDLAAVKNILDNDR
jgi:hypothetical protein